MAPRSLILYIARKKQIVEVIIRIVNLVTRDDTGHLHLKLFRILKKFETLAILF